MLILTRKADEAVQVGNVVVKVLRLQGGRVVLGIEAPADVQVTRCDRPPRKSF